MVEQVSGWKVSDGAVFESKIKAVRVEAELQLKKLDIFNDATRRAVIERAGEIVAALQPVIETQDLKQEQG